MNRRDFLKILGLFAIVMIPAAWAFIKSTKTKTRNFNLISQNYNYTIIILEGLIVGSITGIVGAGGGFLIIPVLVIFLNMTIKIAIGTSLLIVASKSLIGFFIGDVLSGITVAVIALPMALAFGDLAFGEKVDDL